MNGVFYDGDHRLVHCAVDLDTSAYVSEDSIDTGLDRARDENEVVELYAHGPANTVPLSKLEHVLAGAQSRGLAFDTYADFAHGTDTRPGLALSFDDTAVDGWYALEPMLEQYGAHVTFFVTRYTKLSDEAHEKLHELAADGHDIEAHTVNHLRAPDYVENFGMDQYLSDEVQPSVDLLRAEGYEVPAFAYPFGARTDEIDHAIRDRVPGISVIRSVDFSIDTVGTPCPND
ncbi:MAG TPA: polysaccharide deacetylase family protein [Kofleriaceae bacterium]